MFPARSETGKKGEPMLKPILALALATALMTVAGCNTMHGFGQDLQKLGDKIERKAEEKKN
jgi:entericidin A